jgi:hypothetical protein
MLAPQVSQRDFAEERLPTMYVYSFSPITFHSLTAPSHWRDFPQNQMLDSNQYRRPFPPTVRLPKHVHRGSFTSVTSAGSGASHYSRLSVDSSAGSRRSSVTSHGSYDFKAPPTLVKTPWELERSRKHPVPSVSRQRPDSAKGFLPPQVFGNLPKEVYRCILQQLEQSHFAGKDGGCITCYLHDLYNISLTNRAWDKAARLQL